MNLIEFIFQEHRTIKLHRVNKLVQSKKHLWNIHIDRICIQHETHIWLKNFLVLETLPEAVVRDIFTLCISQYSEVRSYSQDLLFKILNRVIESHKTVLPMLEQCLKPDVPHHQFKGALHVISMEKYGFFYNWKNANILMPALVKAQHSDKESIVDLLKDVSIKSNRSYTDFSLYTLPAKPPIMSQETLKSLDINSPEIMDQDIELDPDFVKLEKSLSDLIQGGTLHWRHHQMAIGMLLTLLVRDSRPTAQVVNLWLENLLHDDVTIRFIAFQVRKLNFCPFSQFL